MVERDVSQSELFFRPQSYIYGKLQRFQQHWSYDSAAVRHGRQQLCREKVLSGKITERGVVCSLVSKPSRERLYANRLFVSIRDNSECN